MNTRIFMRITGAAFLSFALSACSWGSIEQLDEIALSSPIEFSFPTTSLSKKIGDAVSVVPIMTNGAAINWSVSPASGTVTAWSDIGLSLHSSTGEISGNISCSLSPGTYHYRFTASNHVSSTSRDLSLTISARSSISLSYAGTPYSMVRGTSAGTITPTVSGPSQITYTIAPSLPTGLSINSTTGLISGTPTTVSTPAVPYTVTASEGFCSNSQNTTVSIEVQEKPIVISLTTTNFSFAWGDPITPIAPTVDPTGSAAVSWEISPVAPALDLTTDTGLSFSTLIGQISGTPNNTNTGSTFSFDILARNAYGMASNTIRVAITITARISPAFHYSTTSLTLHRGVTSASTTVVQDAGGQIASYSVSPALPSGLTFNTTNGTVSGTPDVATAENISGTTYTVTATDSFGLTGTNTFQIQIVAQAPAGLSYPTGTTFYRGYRSASLNPTLTTSDGTLTYSVSPALPQGLSINSSTGVISSSDYLSGSYNGPYVITVTNSGGSTSYTLQATFKDFYEKAVNYFLWTGASGDGKWTTPGNWQKLSGSANYPNANTHMAFFTGSCTNCNATIDASITVQGVFLASDYSGTITQGASSVFTVGKNYGSGVPFCTNGGRYGEDWGWVQLGGNFVGSSANLIFSSLDQRGGSFTSSSGTLNLTLIGKTSANFNSSRCRWDTNASDFVGLQVADGATFNHASGSVVITASRYDFSACAGNSFQVSTPTAGLNLNNLSITTYSDTTENPTGCSTLPTQTSPGSGPQAVIFTLGAKLNVAGDLILKRGALRWSHATYSGAGIYFSGKLVAECADAASIPNNVDYTIGQINVPTNKQNCWQGGLVELEANGTSDQTYDVPRQVSNVLLNVNKPAGTVLKPALGKETQDTRFGQLKIASGTFRAPTTNLIIGVYSPGGYTSFTPSYNVALTDASTDAVFDANSGSVLIQQNSVYDMIGGSWNPTVKPQWLGSEGLNPLVFNHLTVDFSHKTLNSSNGLHLGNFASTSDAITVAGNLTILGGTMNYNKIYLSGNLTYGCSHSTYCSNVATGSGAVSTCFSALAPEISFVGPSDQTVSISNPSAIVHKGRWNIEKPSPYTAKVLLGSNLLLSGTSQFTGSATAHRIYVNSGIFDLNGYDLSSNFSIHDSTPCVEGVTNTSPINADLRIINTPNAQVLCNSSNPPDQVTNFSMQYNSGAYKGVNPASCNQPEWF